MKLLYLESRKKDKIDFSWIDFFSLPKKIGLLYTIQFKESADALKRLLEKKGKKVFMEKGVKTCHNGQILGCDASSAIYIMGKVDCFLFLCSGKWHAKRIALSIPNKKPFFLLNSEGIEKIDSNELQNSRKVLITKFLHSEKIGILVSTKHGQENLSEALKLKDELKKKGKKAFIFISDIVSINELENFKTNFFINTSCPGLAFDFQNILNISEYYSFFEKKC